MRNLNIPNLLTLARLALAPFAAHAVVAGKPGWALALFGIAAATDGLDGYLARRMNAKTRLGAYLDPVADKVLLSASYIAFGIAGAAPLWLVILVFGRDVLILLMVAAALLFTNIRSFPPSRWGKLSTFCQIIAAAAVLTAGAFPNWRIPVTALLWIAAAATAASGAGYVWHAVDTLRKRPDRHCLASTPDRI